MICIARDKEKKFALPPLQSCTRSDDVKYTTASYIMFIVTRTASARGRLIYEFRSNRLVRHIDIIYAYNIVFRK